MRTFLYLLTTLVCFSMNACDFEQQSASEHNAIRDTIYADQFNAIEKAGQVENVLLDASQAQREAIERQSSQ